MSLNSQEFKITAKDVLLTLPPILSTDYSSPKYFTYPALKKIVEDASLVHINLHKCKILCRVQY